MAYQFQSQIACDPRITDPFILLIKTFILIVKKKMEEMNGQTNYYKILCVSIQRYLNETHLLTDLAFQKSRRTLSAMQKHPKLQGKGTMPNSHC